MNRRGVFQWRSQPSRRRNRLQLPLRVALTAPFLTQMVLIVGLVGYVSFRNGKSVADAIMGDLGNNTVDKLERHLQDHLNTPQRINAVTQGLISTGVLPADDPHKLSQYFWQQLHTHDSLRFLYLGTAQGGYIGATRESASTVGAAGAISVDMTPTLGPGQIHTYRTDAQGRAQELIQVIENPYDARQRDWFKSAVLRRRSSWSGVFASFYDPILGVTAYNPVYGEGGELLGVLGAELDLDSLGVFLKELDVGPSGAVFLVEPNGLMVATSDGTTLFTRDAETGELQRRGAGESESLLLRAIAPHLWPTTLPSPEAAAARAGIQPTEVVTPPVPADFPLRVEGQVYQVYVQPLARLHQHLDWWAVVVLAEDDFLAERRLSAVHTVILCSLVMLVALWLTLRIAHWLSRPITALHQSAQAIAQGNFDLPIPQTPIRELADLAQVFNQMAVELDGSMGELRDRFQAAFQSAAVGMALVSLEGKTLQVNGALAQMLGYTPAELETLTLEAVTYAADGSSDAQLKAQLQRGEIQTYTLEKRYCHRQGRIVWGLLNMALVRDRHHRPSYFIAQVQDITDRKQLETDLQASHQKLERLATTDSLTQVANRRCFDEYLQQVWGQMQRERGWLSLILVDIDHFKHYNDHYGHPQGDRCLQTVAQALQAMVQRSGDLVARYGGEEFAIVLPNAQRDGAIALAQRIQSHLRDQALPHPASPISPYITLSLGISTCQPHPGSNPTELITLADQALYDAKRQGRDRWVDCPLAVS